MRKFFFKFSCKKFFSIFCRNFFMRVEIVIEKIFLEVILLEGSCIAFKMNYCDGGKNSERIGFYGICSDKIIDYNIRVKKRKWCSNEDCECKRYYDKKISCEELDRNWNDEIGGCFPCYESAALRDFCSYAGYTSKGNSKRIVNAKTGHLCLLTTVEPNKEESERIIVAMFLIGKVFEGNDEECGFVEANENFDYCLEFKPNESHKMKFWKVYHNEEGKKNFRWGSGLFRYFDDECAVKFLEMAVEAKKGTDEEQLATDFLNYYRKLNKI